MTKGGEPIFRMGDAQIKVTVTVIHMENGASFNTLLIYGHCHLNYKSLTIMEV